MEYQTTRLRRYRGYDEILQAIVAQSVIKNDQTHVYWNQIDNFLVSYVEFVKNKQIHKSK